MALITRGMAEGKAVVITRVTCGDGITSADPTKLVAMLGANLTNMVLSNVAYNTTDQTAEVTASLNNSTFSVSRIISEYGLFAKCAGDTSEVLFGYKNNKDTPEVMYPSSGGAQYTERVFKCTIGSFSNLEDGYVHDYSNDGNVSSLYFKNILMGLLGVAQTTLNNSLPDNTGKWGWFDGGEIKKSDFPDLWERVRPDIELAVTNVTSGTWEYLGSSNSKSYFGWYKGTTDEYFRKPNVMEAGHYMRPVSNSSARNSGVHQVGNIQSHNHGASSATAGAHNHTGATSTDGNHTHSLTLGGDGGGDRTTPQSSGNLTWTARAGVVGYAGSHAHSFTTTTVAAHSHTITVDNAGGVETTPPNIAVKIYGLLRF